MTLKIDTYSNQNGGNIFYKATSHPLASELAQDLILTLEESSSVAIFDPFSLIETFAELYSLEKINIEDIFVQNIEERGVIRLNKAVKLITDLRHSNPTTLLVAAFDAARVSQNIKHLIPKNCAVLTMDSIRLPDNMITNKQQYLHPMNFATNFVFFRDSEITHTRLVTTNYWSRYGASKVTLWLRLFGVDGSVLAEWSETVNNDGQIITVDSKEIRNRFKLNNFTGQLFLHAIGIRGHDVIKYALDIYGKDGNALSCTHDANAWPADLYAGLPAPKEDEIVTLWLQNSHPAPIQGNRVGLRTLGDSEVSLIAQEVGPYATLPIEINGILPAATWPKQIEVIAGKHFVRPRYEIRSLSGDTRIAHINVERTDLSPDPNIPKLAETMGKGFILPAPILPTDVWRTIALPTPMSTCQTNLPIAVLIVNPDGKEVHRIRIGKLSRDHTRHIDLSSDLDISYLLDNNYGHCEIIYDFTEGGQADGWLHSLFRFENKNTGNTAETSFGAHIFNTVLTYRQEPQSYSGPPPGLSTRLYLRLGDSPLETLFQLIYPASTKWHSESNTHLSLFNQQGVEVAKRKLKIPCGGSYFSTYSDTFSIPDRQFAGKGAYVIIRDEHCRLFGYHGLMHPDGGFSLDHMFGF